MAAHDLRQIIGIINNNPIIYNVQSREFGPDSNDPNNARPYFIMFKTKEKIEGIENLDFRVECSAEVYELCHNNDYNFHTFAIKFGLQKKQEEPGKESFRFNTDDYNSIIKNNEFNYDKTKKEILRLALAVLESPLLGKLISERDMFYNIEGGYSNIREVLELLTDEGFLKREAKSTGFPYQNHIRMTRFYRLHPAQRDNVKELLKTGFDTDRIIIFISYSNIDKKLAGNLKNELKKRGFEIFLAHHTIKGGRNWLEEILNELDNCDIVIPLLTDNFLKSKYADQEVGYAMAKKKKIFPLMAPNTPHGFLELIQGRKLDFDNIGKTCEEICDDIKSSDEFADYLPKNGQF